MKFKSIKSFTIYCSSSKKIDKKYQNLAYKLGAYLAIKKFNLIYGGGSNGLMGTVANSVKFHGGTVTGIIPKFLVNKENINKNIDKTIIVKNMAERKKILFKKGDAFIALPGGPGTIEEISEIISWFNLGLHKKPIILFNYYNFWNDFIKLYKKLYKEKFMNNNFQKLFYSVKNIREFKKLF